MKRETWKQIVTVLGWIADGVIVFAASLIIFTGIRSPEIWDHELVAAATLLSATGFGWLAWRTVTKAKGWFEGTVSLGWTLFPPLLVAAAGAVHVLPLAPSMGALAFATVAGCLAATDRPDRPAIPEYLRAQPAVLAGVTALAAAGMVAVTMGSLAGPGQGTLNEARWGGYEAPYLWPIAGGLTLVGLVAAAAARARRQERTKSTLPWSWPLVLAVIWATFAPLDTGIRGPTLGDIPLMPINVPGMPNWVLLGLAATAVIALASPFTAGARAPERGTDPARICAATVGGLAVLSAGAWLAIEFEQGVNTQSLYQPVRSWAALVALLIGATVFRDLALWAYLRDAKWSRYPRLTWVGAIFVWWVAVPQLLMAGQVDVGHFIWLAVPPEVLLGPIQGQLHLLAAVGATVWGMVLWRLGRRIETNARIETRSPETEFSASEPSEPTMPDTHLASRGRIAPGAGSRRGEGSVRVSPGLGWLDRSGRHEG